jgi:hypothetical protein
MKIFRGENCPPVSITRKTGAMVCSNAPFDGAGVRKIPFQSAGSTVQLLGEKGLNQGGEGIKTSRRGAAESPWKGANLVASVVREPAPVAIG